MRSLKPENTPGNNRQIFWGNTARHFNEITEGLGVVLSTFATKYHKVYWRTSVDEFKSNHTANGKIKQQMLEQNQLL